jgi:hypothetical protein
MTPVHVLVSPYLYFVEIPPHQNAVALVLPVKAVVTLRLVNAPVSLMTSYA